MEPYRYFGLIILCNPFVHWMSSFWFHLMLYHFYLNKNLHQEALPLTIVLFCLSICLWINTLNDNITMVTQDKTLKNKILRMFKKISSC